MASSRFRELIKKYGKVALGVHFSVSAASITGLYIAIKNNVDVESVFERFGFGVEKQEEQQTIAENLPRTDSDGFVLGETSQDQITAPKKRNRTAELAASSGGALAVAVLCNKALFPIRVPITFVLTPPVAKFLRSRVYKTDIDGIREAQNQFQADKYCVIA